MTETGPGPAEPVDGAAVLYEAVLRTVAEAASAVEARFGGIEERLERAAAGAARSSLDALGERIGRIEASLEGRAAPGPATGGGAGLDDVLEQVRATGDVLAAAVADTGATVSGALERIEAALRLHLAELTGATTAMAELAGALEGRLDDLAGTVRAVAEHAREAARSHASVVVLRDEVGALRSLASSSATVLGAKSDALAAALAELRSALVAPVDVRRDIR